MNNLIKIFNVKKANELIDLGFAYTLESINGTTVYAFILCDKLDKYIKSNFNKNDYLIDNILRF